MRAWSPPSASISLTICLTPSHPAFALSAGFISIPHDFSLSDLKPRLQALLGSGGGTSGQANTIIGSADEFSVYSAVNGGSAHGGKNGAANGANGSNGSSGVEGAPANGSYANGAGAKQGAYATSGANGRYSNGSGSSGKGFGRDSSSNRGSNSSGYRRSGRDNGRAEGAGAYAGSSRGGPASAFGDSADATPAAGAAALRASRIQQRVRQTVAPPPQRRPGVPAAARLAIRQPAAAARLLL